MEPPKPLQWHRRHAITLAGQLPDNPDDMILVIAALQELVDKFLVDVPADPIQMSKNVVPFKG
jgi:hypothetical protein